MFSENSRKRNLTILLLFFYLLLLAPSFFILNVENAGIVVESHEVPFQGLPDEVRDQLHDESTYYITIVDPPLSDGQIAIISQQMLYKKGDFIRAKDVKNKWYSELSMLPTFNEEDFGIIILGKTENIVCGRWLIEKISGLEQFSLNKIIFKLAPKIFLIGGVLFTVALSLVLEKGIALWNIPCVLLCYSFQYFFLGIITFLNHIEVDEKYLAFGLLFVFLLPFTLWVYNKENSEEGEEKILEISSKQKQIISKLFYGEETHRKNRFAFIETEKGTIRVELFEDKAPVNTSSFVALALLGFYNGLNIVNLIAESVIITDRLKIDKETLKSISIPLEVVPELQDTKNALGMGYDSRGFGDGSIYIFLNELSIFEQKRAIFGNVVEGLDVLKKITVGDKILKITIG